MSILSQKGVRAELKLDDKESKAIDDLVAKSGEKYRVQIQGGGDPEEIEKQIKDEFTAIDKELKGDIKALVTADQYKRFEELNLQSLGVDVFYLDQVQGELKLTDAQKKVADSEADKVQEYMASLAEATNTNGEQQVRLNPNKEQLKKISEMRRKGLEAVLASLTDDQKKKWADMIGAKFDFDSNA